MEEKIYDNSNIAESYAGVTTPLTFSFARYVYQEVYQHFCKMMGANRGLIQKNKNIFEHMIEFIGYRIYYNLNSWYTMLSFFPAFKLSSEFMEKMMGVEKHTEFKRDKQYGFYSKYFLFFSQVILQIIRISFTFSFLGLRMKRFKKYFDAVFSEFNAIDLNKLSLYELRSLYQKAEARLLAQWRVPIANDFAVMVSVGLADKLFKKWLASDKAYSFLTMTTNRSLAFLDPGKRIMQIAKFIQQHESVKKLFLGKHSEEEILKLLYAKFASHQVTIEVKNYLKDFGTRIPNELKLESETLMENPKYLIAIIKRFVEKEYVPAEGLLKKQQPQQPREIVFRGVCLHKKIILKWLLRWASNSIRRREEARFHRTLIFGFVRRIFLAIGKKMEQNNIIIKDRDIFYLTKEEIFNIIDNKEFNANPVMIIEQRKRKFAEWQNIELPRRIESAKSIFEIEQDISHRSSINKRSDLNELVGRVASCPNNMQVFFGTALTLKNFDPTADFKGKILVTCQTDPGWTIIFPLLEGVVVERGGMLSHAAIVARELNIPCIVGVERATEIINTGANIKLDLQKGLVQKI